MINSYGLGQSWGPFRKVMRTVEQVIAQGHPNVWTPELIAQLTPEAAAALPASQRAAIVRTLGLEPSDRSVGVQSGWAQFAPPQIPPVLAPVPSVGINTGAAQAAASPFGPAPLTASVFGNPRLWLGVLALGGVYLLVARRGRGARRRRR